VLVQDLLIASVSVPRAQLETVARVYQETFGWQLRWAGQLDPALAASWGVDPPARRVLLLGPADEQRGLVRLIEGESPPPPPLATFGWSALEITVRDCDTLAEQLRHSPHFRVNGEPADLRFSSDPPGQRAMQAVGPAGEQLYLTQILRQTPGRELAMPPAGAEVGCVFIAVLATPDYAAASAFYVRVLGYELYLETMAALKVARRELQLPEGTSFRLGALRPLGETRIELDGYPPGVGALRQRRPGELPPGFSLVTLAVTDLDAVLAAAAALGHAPLAPAVALTDPPYAGRWSATLRGGTGELVELVGARSRPGVP